MDYMQTEYDKGNYVIAGGDFNQTFSNVDLSKYPKMNDWECPVIDVNEYPDFKFNMDDTVPTCRSLYKTYFYKKNYLSEWQFYKSMKTNFLKNAVCLLTLQRDFSSDPGKPQ